MKAEKIIVGKIYTADKVHSIAQAMAIADGKILAIGSKNDVMEYACDTTEIIESNGLVVPGMTEGHAHLTLSTEMIFGVPLGHQTDPEEYLKRIREYMNNHPEDKMIIGSGYDNAVFGEMGPTAELLDQVSKDIPIVMMASDHHSRWLNSKALEVAGIDENTPEVPNGVIVRYPGTNKPTGWLKESAGSLAKKATKATTPEEFAEGILFYQNIGLENGITNVHEPVVDISYSDNVESMLKGYEILAKEDKLKLTCRLSYGVDETADLEHCISVMKEYREKFSKYDKVRLDMMKLFVDGVVECHTAYLREDYADTPGDKGEPIWEQEKYNKAVLRAMEEGFDVHTHAIGDGGMDATLEGYEKAREALGDGFRNQITHLQIVQPDQIKRMADNDILAVVNPYWHFAAPIYFDALEVPFLGRERASKEYPLSSFIKAGVKTSQASDYSVTMPPRTMDSLHLMVNRQEMGEQSQPVLGEEERITVEEALDVLTIGGAYQLRLEETKGSLEAGKDADFVLLDKDVLTMERSEIYTAEVIATYINGKCCFCR